MSDLEHRFTYHSPSGGTHVRYQALRAKGLELSLLITDLVPEGREREQAVTRIEEAIFWANAGIARNS